MTSQSLDDQTTATNRSSTVNVPWPSAGQSWWTVFVFSLTLMVGYLDRGILNLLVESIKRDLHLTDTQISLLIGFSFVIFYLLLGLPIARRIDTGSRRFILGCCVTVWSVCTTLCGVAHNFWQLALCRIGVGAGDAATSPAISSMISDLFPKERLPRAMSVMVFAYIAGNGLSMILGAAVIGSLADVHTIAIPLIGNIYSWQMTFFIIGLPGLLVALLYFTVREPLRRGRLPGHAPLTALPVSDVLRFMRGNLSAYAPMFLGLASRSIVSFGIAAWTPALFSRTHGWSASHYGSIAGVISLIVSPIGVLAGIYIGERLFARGYSDANLRLTAICAWLIVPAAILMPLMPTPELALVMIGWTSMVGVACIGAENAALLVITPNEMRGQVSALYLFVYNVIGYGIGPTIVALFTDYVFGHDNDLRYAMVTTAAVLAPIGALVLTLGVKPYGKAYVRSKDWH